MIYPLSTLEGQLTRTVTIVSSELERHDPELVGQYVHRDDDGRKFLWGPSPERYAFHDVDTVKEADSVFFLCPLCFEKNQGSRGTHGVRVTFADRNVPDAASSRGKDGKPTRWAASGTNLNDLVLSPSILLHGGCAWHGFVGSSGIPPGHAG